MRFFLEFAAGVELKLEPGLGVLLGLLLGVLLLWGGVELLEVAVGRGFRACITFRVDGIGWGALLVKYLVIFCTGTVTFFFSL